MLLSGKYLYSGDNLSSVYAIRECVFQNENRKSKEELLNHIDKESIHVVIYLGSKAVATGQLYTENGDYYIDNICVVKEERSNKYGDFVVRMLVDKAFTCGAKEVYVESPKEFIDFFDKIGFQLNTEPTNESEKIKMKLINGGLCKGCKTL